MNSIQIINYYCENEMKRLKKICDPIIKKKHIAQMYNDDLYSVAMQTLMESVESYDESHQCKFNTYLVGNINRSFYDWQRDNCRLKRCNVQKDNNGKIIKDKDGHSVVVANVSFDKPTEDGVDLQEKLASNFVLNDGFSHEMEIYLRKLSKQQRAILFKLEKGYRPHEIRKILHITKKEYDDGFLAITSYENTKILHK